MEIDLFLDGCTGYEKTEQCNSAKLEHQPINVCV